MKTHKRLYPLKLLSLSTLNGAIVGIFITLYNKIVHEAENIFEVASIFVKDNLWFIPLLLCFFIGIAFLIRYFSSFEKGVRGSGVPQAEGIMRGILYFRWYTAIPIVLCCSLLAVLCGISMGAEGTSILMGGLIGSMVAKITNQKFYTECYLVTGGAGAGLATASNMPLAGIVFAVEEAHKNFSPLLICSTTCTIITAMMFSHLLRPNVPLYPIFVNVLPSHFTSYLIILIFGMFVGLIAKFFTRVYLYTKRLLEKHIKNGYAMIIPFLFIIPLIFFLPESLGTGSKAIHGVTSGMFSLYSLAIILLVKILFTVLCSSSNLIGGIFVPMLAIGALAGGLFSGLIESFMPSDLNIFIFVIIGMSVMFANVAGAPITAIILSIELTGNFMTALPVIVATFGGMLINIITHEHPLYETLLIQLKEELSHGEDSEIEYITKTVAEHSYIANHVVRDLILPNDTVLQNILRGIDNIVPNSETKIRPHDILLFKCETLDKEESEIVLEDLCHEIGAKR